MRGVHRQFITLARDTRHVEVFLDLESAEITIMNAKKLSKWNIRVFCVRVLCVCLSERLKLGEGGGGAVQPANRS